MAPQPAFSASFRNPSATSFDQLVSNQSGLFTIGPVIRTSVPAHAADNFRVYIMNRMPVNLSTPTHYTPALHPHFPPPPNNRPTLPPIFSHTPPTSLSLPRPAPVRSSAELEPFPPARPPSTSAGRSGARLSGRMYARPLCWRGGHRMKTGDKLLALGSACLILNRMQALSWALASGAKSTTFVQERALMLAVSSAFGSVKLVWMMCEQ